MFTSRFATSMVLTAVSLAALSACGNDEAATGGDSYASSAPEPSSENPIDLAIADTSLGSVVVDGEQMTAYVFDMDKPGAEASACVDECAALWPAIETTEDAPTVEGVTGEIGTITSVGGGKQITVNGLPVYTFANDTQPGDVNGNGVKGVWHAITSDGTAVAASN